MPVNDALAHQSLARPLTQAERDFAEALERIFGSGQADFAVVAVLLEEQHVARPSAMTGSWTPGVLEEEIARINASLDQAYLGQDGPAS